MSILFVGNATLGGAQMRGRDVAERMGERFSDWSKLPSGPLDTVVVVKYWTPQIRELRRRCRLLVGDPLDCFSQTYPKMEPAAFWRWYYDEVTPDVILATSPACAGTMEGCGAKVVLAPHHADERVGTDWHDPSGPVVYAGGERFLGDERPRIEVACRDLGREFVCRFDKECWQALNGASVSLCVRCGKEATRLNLECKPTIKAANAIRAGIPILTTADDQACLGLAPCSAFLSRLDYGKGYEWEYHLSYARLGVSGCTPRYPWTIETHCDLLRRLASA